MKTIYIEKDNKFSFLALSPQPSPKGAREKKGFLPSSRERKKKKLIIFFCQVERITKEREKRRKSNRT